MDTVTVISTGLQVFWVIGLLFMPGFVITLVRYPWLHEIGVMRRLIYSVIVSIVFILAFVLVMDILGVDPVPGIIGPWIAIFLALMLTVWLLEVFSVGRRFQEWIARRLSRSVSYGVIRRNFSRRLHATLDLRQVSTTVVVYHESRRSGRNRISHSWLLNVGSEIAIQEIVEYKGKNPGRVILPPPHPKTRYIELAVVEYNDGRVSLVEDLQVYPVHVARNLTGTIPGLRPHRGILDISKRIYNKTAVTEVQWIYTHDFHLLAITYPDDTPDQLVDRVIARIDQIVVSLQCGIRVIPVAEDPVVHGDAGSAVTAQPKPTTPVSQPGRVFPDAGSAVTAKPKPAPPAPVRTARAVQPPRIIAGPDQRDGRSMQEKILSNADMSGITPASFRTTDRLIGRIVIPKEVDINKRVFSRIEEIMDDDWLYT
jgi:hypothetical protein